MKIVEGTPEEIVEYQERIANKRLATPSAQIQAEDTEPEDEPDPAPARSATMPADVDDDDWFFVRQRVTSKAPNAATERRVLQYLTGIFELDAYVQIGRSERTKDGLTEYVMVRDNGPRRFGAVAYVRPNGGLTLRLQAADVEDVDDERVKARKVAKSQQYAINCPLVDDGAVELALSLTARALKKIRKA